MLAAPVRRPGRSAAWTAPPVTCHPRRPPHRRTGSAWRKRSRLRARWSRCRIGVCCTRSKAVTSPLARRPVPLLPLPRQRWSRWCWQSWRSSVACRRGGRRPQGRCTRHNAAYLVVAGAGPPPTAGWWGPGTADLTPCLESPPASRGWRARAPRAVKQARCSVPRRGGRRSATHDWLEATRRERPAPRHRVSHSQSWVAGLRPPRRGTHGRLLLLADFTAQGPTRATTWPAPRATTWPAPPAATRPTSGGGPTSRTCRSRSAPRPACRRPRAPAKQKP